MIKSNKLIILFFFILQHALAQSTNDNLDKQNNLEEDSITIILNDSALNHFFAKLYLLEKGDRNRVNIVHIGNSHTQAGFLTGEIRNNLQHKFGNAGRGLIFPYKVANSNSPRDVYSFSNVNWDGFRNVHYRDKPNIGISGFLIETCDSNAILKVSLNPKDNLHYYFNKLKFFRPIGDEYFDIYVSGSKERDILEKTTIRIEDVFYTVRSGDYLGKIAKKLKTSVGNIKKLNGLKGDLIYTGQELIVKKEEVKVSEVPKDAFYDIKFIRSNDSACTEITLDTLVEYVFLRNIKSNKEQKKMQWDGIMLENTFNAGILYHMIGVNGAMYDDYNNTDRFFDQLPYLNPDLIIVSLGTNETFEDNVKIYNDIQKFYKEIRIIDKDIPLIIWTPPDSEKKPNEVRLIADSLILFSESNEIPYFDLYNILGGEGSFIELKKQKMTSNDKIHFRANGYKMQGKLFSNALLKAYKRYKKRIDE